MNQGENHILDDEQLERENLLQQNVAMADDMYQHEPVEQVDEPLENVEMDVDNDSSSESDYQDGNEFDDEDPISNFRDIDDTMEDSRSSDESELVYVLRSENKLCNIKSMVKMLITRRQERKTATYSFQPLRLIKCLYKNTLDSWPYPIARSGHRVTASKSYLYSLGGYNPNLYTSPGRRKLFQELWAYNFATNQWNLLQNADNTDMPKEVASNAFVIYNNILISHGGTGFPFGETCSNDCYVYTTGKNPQVVLLKVSGDLPAAQYGPGIVVHNDYLYTIGGTTGFDYSCDIYRLNLQTKVWENVYICRPEIRDDPEGRYRHEVVYDGRHIYVLGGGTASTVYDLQRIPAFNLETNHWDYFETFPDRTGSTSQEAGYPKARKCFSCVQHTLQNGDIEAFITGGLQGDAATHFNDIWKLNLRTKQWSKIHSATLPRPLYFHSAAHSGNGCMYIFGGIEYSEKELCRRNDLFKMWMTIPKLIDICWDAITYYNSNLHQFDRNTLLSAGIPDRFLNRLPDDSTKL